MGQDLSRLVGDLLEHLRHILLVQHMGTPPDSLPVTEETRERLLAQANQLGQSEVLRLIDLLALAVDEIREGGDPRLPLELALVKVTRPQADLSREALLLRLEHLEARPRASPPQPAASEAAPEPVAAAAPPEPAEEPDPLPPLELEQIREQWRQVILPAVEDRSIPIATMLAEAQPIDLADTRLVIEFPAYAAFHRKLAEEPKNASILTEVLHEVTGRRLQPSFVVGEAVEAKTEAGDQDEPETEEDIVSLLKNTFDARELEEHNP